MLKRKATNFMKNWINTKDKKCLVVQGARQTGKTYTVERFAEENYEELVEINFKQMPSAMEIFSGDLTVDAMVMGMRFRFPEKKIIPGKTLIFLDEIQECQEAVTSLKFWAIDNKYDVIVTNPPIRAGKETVTKILVEAKEHLNLHGEIWVVIQKKQGAPSAKKNLESVFGNANVVKKDKGYYILKAINLSLIHI